MDSGGARAVLSGPGVGRRLPMPLFIPFGWWVANLVPLIFPVLGMLADRRRFGRIYRAWLWGVGIILAALVAADLLAYSPLGRSFTEWLLAGTPGAARGREAFFPL